MDQVPENGEEAMVATAVERPLVDGADRRTLTAVAERVAVVETRLDALKDDTTTIRRNIHESANQTQHVIASLHALQQADTLAIARHETATADRRRLEEAMEAHRRDSLAMQQENKIAAAAVHAELAISNTKLHERIDYLMWRLMGALAAIITAEMAAMGYLMTKGLPWEHVVH